MMLNMKWLELKRRITPEAKIQHKRKEIKKFYIGDGAIAQW